jgi:hypothetical protein
LRADRALDARVEPAHDHFFNWAKCPHLTGQQWDQPGHDEPFMSSAGIKPAA